ncbi:MAG: endonuclease/exonuclease/phosphatase family protein [Bacteroidales bacterium]|nr:endonuclease/exonuclease/phosphatase family protein [Bacteroidales bacterium]MCF8403552.1 endonuclease/exonuclease/phosphatase family protein [Bacteroidales bacterium]
MKIALKLIIGCVLCIISIFVFYLVGVIIYSLITAFHPDEEEVLIANKNSDKGINALDTLTALSWNIGYAGLGKEMDFFYEEGKKVKPTAEEHNKYLTGIGDFIQKQSNIDFGFFQEVDFKSNRSYKTNEYDYLQKRLADHSSVFALNYKAGFVPVPLYNPMGKVNSGMAFFSKYRLAESKRLSTPGKHKWPKQMYLLKRCFIVNRINLENEKELVLFNIHNSAFGDEKDFRKAELEMLKKLVLEEYEKGNYVLVGGDWNQNPPGMEVTVIGKYISKEVWPVSPDFMPAGWTWAFDNSLPTNRDVNKPFDFTRTTTTILDYFLSSPNVEVIEIQTFDLEFKDSDHQPVMLTFKLK